MTRRFAFIPEEFTSKKIQNPWLKKRVCQKIWEFVGSKTHRIKYVDVTLYFKSTAGIRKSDFTPSRTVRIRGPKP